MTARDWRHGGRAAPPSRYSGMTAAAHEDKIRQLTVAKYRAICEANRGSTFAESVLKQIRERGFVSRKQAQALDRLAARRPSVPKPVKRYPAGQTP